MKQLILIFSLFIMASCSSDSDFANGKRQLEAQGYTNVVNTGFEAFCCSDEDSYSTGFTAVDPKGNTVKGCFCSAWMKGLTIRFE